MWPLLLACHGPPPGPDTLLLYWLPYDNDLGPAAAPVLEGLRSATASGRVEVLAQVDTPGQAGMERIAFARGEARREAVAAEDSGSISAFAEFLEAGTARQARQVAVFVLDHGGDLPRLARDDDPDTGGPPTWLSLPDLAAAMAGFRAGQPGAVRALVLQVCGKATVETAWELRGAGEALLFSALPLGAPNTYYEALDGLPADWGGPELLAVLARGDAPSMYASWSCLRTEALAGLPAALEGLPLPDPAWIQGPLAATTWVYAGDGWTDLGALADRAGASALRSWMQGASCGVARSPSPPAHLTLGFPDPADLSGLALYLPPPKGLPASHALSIYRDTALQAWAEALTRPAAAPSSGPAAGQR